VNERTWQVVLALLGGVQLAVAGWAAVDAGSFTEHLADFGPENPHLVHDFAAAFGTFGVGLLLAARFACWRRPVLAAIWTGLHAVSHLVDVGDAHPHAVGPVESLALVAATPLFIGLAVLSSKTAR
jgi:hypothetical protein